MAYTRVNWEDLPSTNTPINATNLNKMDKGIKDLEGEIPTNDHLVKVSTEVDEDYRVNLLHSHNLVNVSTNIIGVLQSNGSISSGSTYADYRTTDYIKVNPNTTYTITRTYIGSEEDFIRVAYYKDDKTFIERPVINDNPETITTSSTCYYIRLSYKNSDNTNIQLVEGDTALPYEPFTQNSMQVDETKFTDTINVGQLVDNRSRVNVLHSKNLTDGIWENGGWSNTGEKTDSPSFTRTANPIYVKPNTTYTLKISKSNNQIVVYYYSASGYIDLAFVQNADTYTFTTPANCVKINFRLSGQGISYTNTMLNEGSTALPYEPYTQNQILVDNEKYSDTLNVGTSLDNRSRVNILKGEQLYNSSNVELRKTWQGNANNNRARLVLPISPNETYNVRVKGSGVVLAVIETTETPTSSSISNATYTPTVNTQLTEKATSTTKYLTLQLDAGTTFTTAILNSLEISIYYGTGSIYVDNEEIYSKPVVLYNNASGSNSSITLSDSLDNYEYIEIYFGNQTKTKNSSIKLMKGCYNTQLKLINISNTSTAQNTQEYYKDISLSGTSITTNLNRALFIVSASAEYSTATITSSNDNLVYIYRVVGYK
jgi:hypothetical protein